MKTIIKLGIAITLLTITAISNKVMAQEQTKEELIESINMLSRVYVASDYYFQVKNTEGDSEFSFYTDNPKNDYELLFNLKNDIDIENSSVVEYENGFYLELVPKNKIKQIKNNETTYSSNPVKIFTKVNEVKTSYLHDRLSKLTEMIDNGAVNLSQKNNASNKTINLTKEETVQYLDKKIKEIYENYRSIHYNDENGNLATLKFHYFEQPSVSIDENKLKFTVYRANNYKKLRPTSEKLYTGDFSHQYVYKETISCDYIEQELIAEFNPAHIISINRGKNYVNGEPIGIIEIKLKSKTGITDLIGYAPRQYVTSMYGRHCVDFGKTEANNREITNTIFIEYLQLDETNFDKIRKALEYLQSLLNAEDDPFG